jgi:hypothetical protein
VGRGWVVVAKKSLVGEIERDVAGLVKPKCSIKLPEKMKMNIKMEFQMGFPNGVPKWGSQMGFPNGVPK